MKKSGVGLQSHPGGETIIDKHEEAEDEDGGVVDLAQEKAEDNIDGSQSKRSAAQTIVVWKRGERKKEREADHDPYVQRVGAEAIPLPIDGHDDSDEQARH